MAAQQIPCGTQGLQYGPRGTGNRALYGLFEPKSPAKRRHLRRNGPVRVQFPSPRPDRFRSRRMTPSAVRHIPVLGRQAVEMLSPRDGGIYVDATFGAGGYSRAILDIAGTRIIGIDRDRSAIAGGFDLVDRSDGRLTLAEDKFSNLAGICAAQGIDAVDGVVMDVGVSSMQLDEAERGFSFRLGGPLDMRMGHDGPTAADVIARASAAERVLKPGGRLAVVSFHSLEDRIVKNFLGERAKAGGGSRHLPEVTQAAPSFHILTKRPVTPDDGEISANPRARSAKLRAAERTAAPAHIAAALPAWPSLDDVMRGG